MSTCRTSIHHLRARIKPPACLLRPQSHPRDPLHTRIKHPAHPTHHRSNQPPPHHHRAFHTTRPHSADANINPYETLNVPQSCTQAEIKKAFYTLSKTHHPDHNPNNQEEASKKFVAISDAYHLIGTPSARSKWDREHAARPSPTSDSSSGAPSGSGFGARRASGLSRRRAQFRGPPPSFYRNGGYGAHTQRESNAGAQERADAFRAQQEQAYAGAQGQGFAGATGANWPFQTDPNDVPHFDREGHYKTTRSVEDQLSQGRKKRRKAWAARSEEAEEYETESTSDVIGKFVLYGGTLFVGIGASSWLLAKTS